jgi:basic membrane protein A
MSFTKHLFGAAAAIALTAGMASAEPALIFDLGGKFDKSFNEAGYNGAQRWADETGGTYREIELSSEAQREQALRRFAEAGANPIITMGFAMTVPIETVAPEYPDTKFVNIDGWANLPNVQTVSFAEHEGSYLAGVMAAKASKSGTVGFIGGMDIPLIRKFACGYAQGVKSVNPDATVISNMTGTTPAAWNDPVKGSELTKAQIAEGADVVYAAAGGTGVGVLQTAADEGILSIGVDSNQNYLHSGQVLTSMLKRVDNTVYNALKAGADGLETGFIMMDLASEGVGVAFDEHNAPLVNDDMKMAVAAATDGIVSGSITVENYAASESCSVLEF